LNGTNQLLACDGEVNLLGENINTTKKTMYIVMLCNQNAGQSNNLIIANKSFGNVAKFKYCIHDEIKNRVNFGNVCYHSAQNLPSRLLSKSFKVKIYRTIILPVVLYGCETWCLTLREHKLRVSENRETRRRFAPKREQVAGD